MEKALVALMPGASLFALTVALAAGCGGDSLDERADAGTSREASAPDASVPDAAAVVPCSGAGLSSCTVGRCALSGDSSSLPAGSIVTLTDEPLDPALTGDAVLPYLCKVDLPVGVDAGTAAFTLQMMVAAGDLTPSETGVLFAWSPPSAREVASSNAAAGTIAGIITASGTYGGASAPGTASLTAILGTDPRSSADLPSLIRNVTGASMDAAIYDGTHLYIGSGGRVLIYDGIPADPSVKPAVVLGQPTLDTSIAGVSAALLDSSVSAIWSNGQKLVVSSGARTLVWNQVPTVSFTPADLVLGQPDFSTDVANNGGVSAASNAEPTGIDSDGTRLAVTDFVNNRVLVWDTFPTSLNQPATSVIGQPSFATRGVDVGQLPLYLPWDVAFQGGGAYIASYFDGLQHTSSPTTQDAPRDYQAALWADAVQPTEMCNTQSVTFTQSGALAATDLCGRRVGLWKTPPTAVTPMSFALGQPDTRVDSAHPTSASALSPTTDRPGAKGSNGKFLVHDSARVLLWDPEPTYAFEPAARVFGQPGFTTDDVAIDYRSISASTLGYPADVATAGGVIAVADRGNNRVVLYTEASATTGASASVVLGQPDGASYIPNLDQVTPSAARMSGPGGVALDGAHVIVADTENHRVLIWNQVPTASGAPADLVLGQSDFTGHRPNHGRGDTDGDGHSDAAADGFFAPTGVVSDGTHLFVADRVNHRVLEWTTFPTKSGQAADVVIGQMDMTGVIANGGAGPSTYGPASFQLPTALALSGTTLYVADTENNRVVRIEDVTTAPTATAWLGQADGVTVSDPNARDQTSANAGYANQPGTTASTVLRPRGVVVAGGLLYISEYDSNRVQVFDAATLAPVALLGQTDPTSAVINAGAIGAASLSSPTGLAADADHLYVADSANHRVLSWSLAAPPATGSAASLALGQTSFVNGGFDGAVVPSAGGTSRPRGLAVDGGQLFSTEADHNRVVVTATPTASATGTVTAGGIVRLYGQTSETTLAANSGGAPSASTLSSPRGVFADSAHVLVADSGNHRVLVYDRASTSLAATLVLGQSSFSAIAANAGGAPSASTLSDPEGVYSDGAHLYISDTGNHRVLVWDTFPTSSGQPADRVLGQGSFTDVLPNRGGAAAADTMSSPTAVHVSSGHLYIADSGNNRVLTFATLPTTSGIAADGALGQPDLTTRTPGAMPSDPSTLAGPVQLSDDGSYLYICDRDLARVVAYPLASAGAGALAYPPGVVTLAGPDGLAVERTPLFTSRLYIADTNDGRVVVVDGVSRLASP